jgi:hypothetical protein
MDAYQASLNFGLNLGWYPGFRRFSAQMWGAKDQKRGSPGFVACEYGLLDLEATP